MGSLAEFLAAHHDEIRGRFAARVQDARSDGVLVEHLPALLDALIAAVATDELTSIPTGALLPASAPAIHVMVSEVGLLHDCIFQLLETAGHAPSLRELRVLSACLAEATAAAARRHTEANHARAEAERLHLLGLFQQAPGFMCYLQGSELVFEIANAAYFQLVGHRDILGKPLRAALPEIAGQGYFELLDRVLATGEPFVGRGMQAQLQREPGAPLTTAHLDLVYQPIRGPDGRVTGILVQGQDVTAVHDQASRRRAAEDALRTSEERYRTLFESIDDGYCLMQMIVDDTGKTVDYKFLESNAAFEGQTGLRGAIGKTALELVPSLDESWFRLYGGVADTGVPARFENHAPAMGRWFDVYASRVGAPALRLVALVFKDVSERKRVEQERVHLLARESEARHRAEEANRIKDDFLATVSHELRTPLTAILGWVQMLQIGNLAPDKRTRALETIERNARAQAQLIEGLLDVSSILVGKLRLEVAPVDVRAVVEQTIETIRPAADAKQIRLQATLASDSTVMGDAHRLQQMVWNLLSNAVKFTPKNGRVQVLVECRDSSVDITVADTGRGIDPAFQPHVFERFRQADSPTTRAHGGLGLGLSIVRQLVELHGGTVSVYSEGEGRGASFTVRLPLAVSRRVEVVAPPGLQPTHTRGIDCPPGLHGLRVLVVDDEVDTREMLRALLEQCGVEVTLASSAPECLHRIVADPPDVLLSDIGMPEEDGYSLIEKIRKLAPEAGGAVAAVALTAYARTEDRTRALLAGFNNHISKPVEPLELLAVLASLSARPRLTM